MALFDKLKGLADKAKETAKDVAGITKGVASSIAKDLEKMGNSPEAQAAREEARKAEAARAAEEVKRLQQEKNELFNYLVENHGSTDPEYKAKYELFLKDATVEDFERLENKIKKKERAEASAVIKKHIEKLRTKTNCDMGQGDCCWLGENFYCTCSADTDCPRKKYIKTKQFDTLISEAHFPYIKAFASFKKEQDMFNEGQWRYRNNNVDYELSDVLRVFFATYLSEYKWKQIDKDFVLDYFYENGLGRNNAALDILFTYKEKTDGKALPWFPAILEFEGIDLHQDFFKNPSLYERNYKDFRYTVRILDIVNNPDKLSAYFDDASHVSIEQLYNPDGTIKEAGIGGPKEGFYGDVIYNIVESWGGEEV